MSKVIRLHPDGKSQTTTFDLPVVSETHFDKVGLCPHCRADGLNSVILEYIDQGLKKSHNDLMQCTACNGLYLISNADALKNVQQPIMMVWHVKEQIQAD